MVQGMEVVAIASRNEAKAEAFAKEHGIARFHGSYEALLADPSVDVIYNPLPNSLHAEWSIRALRAGKGVLCEKPFAANVHSARLMADCARETGLPLMEAMHYRFHPLALFIDDVIRSRQLGRIVHIDTGLEVAAQFIKPDDIRFQSELGGGAMMDLGTYCVNALRWISEEEPLVAEASGTLAAAEVDSAMRARYVFPSGAEGTLQCSLTAVHIRGWLTVTGTNGRLNVHNPFHPQLGNTVMIETHEGSKRITFDRTPTYLFQANAFARAWRGEEELMITPEDSILNMKAIDATYLASGLSPR